MKVQDSEIEQVVDIDVGATLTRHQREALGRSFNLADGHSRQGQSQAQLQFLQNLPALYQECLVVNQEAVEQEFFGAFFGMAGQPSVFELPRPNLHYSASVSIAIAAAHLRARGGRAMVIHPTFDNIPALLGRHGVPMLPVGFEELLQLQILPPDVTALMLVLPNNPTGDHLEAEQLLRVGQLCAGHDVDLVIDFSFRFASELCEWDQYAVLADTGARFLCIEDTGKTWPALDLKVGMTVSSAALAGDIKEITEDYILNVSPFLLRLLTKYVESDPERSWRAIADENRRVLADVLVGSEVAIEGTGGAGTIAWLKLGEGWDSDDFCRWASGEGIAVCPGGPFFWHEPEKGRRYVRVALLRPCDYFADAASHLRSLLNTYANAKAPAGAVGEVSRANAA